MAPDCLGRPGWAYPGLPGTRGWIAAKAKPGWAGLDAGFNGVSWTHINRDPAGHDVHTGALADFVTAAFIQ